MRDDELLGRCLDGTTQNPNEAVSQIVWKKSLKDKCISRLILEIGVPSAVTDFNNVCQDLKNYLVVSSVGVNTRSGVIEKKMNHKFEETIKMS